MIFGFLLALHMANAQITIDPHAKVGSPRDVQAAPRRGVVYYIDGHGGNDENAGTSRKSAWKSMERVNRAALGPGDSVLFASGQTFEGRLKLSIRGSRTSPIVI